MTVTNPKRNPKGYDIEKARKLLEDQFKLEEKKPFYQLTFEQLTQLNYYLNDEAIIQAIKNGGGSITIQKYFNLIANQININHDEIDQNLKTAYEQFIKDYLLSSDFYDGNGNLVLNTAKSLGGITDHKDAKVSDKSSIQTRPGSYQDGSNTSGGGSIRTVKIDIAKIASQYNIPLEILIKVIGTKQVFYSTEDFIKTALQYLASNQSASRFSTPSIRRITENANNLSPTDQSKALEFIIKNIIFQTLADKARTLSEVDAIKRRMQSLTAGIADQLAINTGGLNLFKALNSLANDRSVKILSQTNTLDKESTSQVPFSPTGASQYEDGKYIGSQTNKTGETGENDPSGLEGIKQDAKNAKGSNSANNDSLTRSNSQDEQQETRVIEDNKAPQLGGIKQPDNNAQETQSPTNAPTTQSSNEVASTQKSQKTISSSSGFGNRIRNSFRNPLKRAENQNSTSGGKGKSQIDDLSSKAKDMALSALTGGASKVFDKIFGKENRTLLIVLLAVVFLLITASPVIAFPTVTRVLYCEEPLKSNIVVVGGRTAFDLASGKIVPKYIWKDCIQECLSNGGTVTDAKGTPCQQKRIIGGGVNVANVGALLNVGTESQNANLLYIMLATKWQETGGFSFDYGANDGEFSDLDSCGPYQQRLIELGYEGNPILAGVVQQLIGQEKYQEFFSKSNPNMVNLYSLESRKAGSVEMSFTAAKVCQPLQKYLRSTNNLGMWDYLFYERIKDERRLDEVLNASKNTNFTNLVEKIQRGVPKPGIDQFKDYLYDNNVYNEIKALCGSQNSITSSSSSSENTLSNKGIRDTLIASEDIKTLSEFTSIFKSIQAFRSNNIDVNAQEIDYNNWLNIGGYAFDNQNFLQSGNRFTQLNETSGGNNSGGIDISFGNREAGIVDAGQANGFPLFAALGEGVVTLSISGKPHLRAGEGLGFGNRVSIYYPNYNPLGLSPNGIVVDYSHLQDVYVTLNSKVSPSTLIGTQGHSGSVRPSDDFYQTDIALLPGTPQLKQQYAEGKYSDMITPPRINVIESSLSTSQTNAVYTEFLKNYLAYYQTNKAQITAGMKSKTYEGLTNTASNITPVSGDFCAPICQEGVITTEGTTNTTGQTASGENFIGSYTDDRPKINAKYTILHYTAISSTADNRNILKGGGLSEGGAHFGITADGLIDTYVPLDTLAEGTFFYSRIYDDNGKMQLPPIPKDDSAKNPSLIRIPFQTRYGDGRDSVDLQSIQYEVYYKPQAYEKGQAPSGTISDAQLKALAQSISKLGHTPNKIFTHWGVQPQLKSDPWDWIPPEGRVTPKLLQFVKYMQENNASGWAGDPNTIAKDIVKRNIKNAIRVIEDDTIGYSRPYTTGSSDGGTDYSSDRYQNTVGSPATLKSELAKLNNQADNEQKPNLAQNIFDGIFGGVEVDAVGTRPTKYKDITAKHQEFLDNIAKKAGYNKKYNDANLNDNGKDLQAEAKIAFNEFKSAVKTATGIDVDILSGYRSRDTQVTTFFDSSKEIQIIYDDTQPNDSSNNKQAETQYLARAKSSAPPGYSEHSTGYALDYYAPSIPSTINLDRNNWPSALEEFVNNPANLSPLGLKLSYPKNSTQGAEYEPWHLLYVGKDGSDPISQFGEGATTTPTIDPCKFTNTGINNLSDSFVTEGTITSYYGPRSGEQHKGIDIAILSDPNPPVIALEDGIVDYADYQTPGEPSTGYGKLVIINHPGSSLQTAYAHLDEFKVKKGQEVKKGTLLGYMGNTGRSTGTHLHFEVRKLDPSSPPGANGEAFDPCTIINCTSETITPPVSITDQYDSLRRKQKK